MTYGPFPVVKYLGPLRGGGGVWGRGVTATTELFRRLNDGRTGHRLPGWEDPGEGESLRVNGMSGLWDHTPRLSGPPEDQETVEYGQRVTTRSQRSSHCVVFFCVQARGTPSARRPRPLSGHRLFTQTRGPKVPPVTIPLSSTNEEIN